MGGMIGRRLLLWTNVAALVVHSAFLIWSLTAENKDSHEVQLYRVKANWTEASLDGFNLELKEGVVVGYKFLSSFSFGAAVASHALAMLLLWKRDVDKDSFSQTYREWILTGFHPNRWLEYGFSASAQAVTLGLGVGIRDQYLLLAIFFLHAVTMYGGYVCELHARPCPVEQDDDYDMRSPDESSCDCLCLTKWVQRQSWLSWFHYDGEFVWRDPFWTRLAPFWGGLLSIGTAWVILIVSFVQSVEDTRELRGEDAPSIPEWVVMALFGTMLLFFSFAINCFLFIWARPSTRRFVASEVIYIVLSLTAKVWLGSLVLANVLMG
jgi:hypothetical protein